MLDDLNQSKFSKWACNCSLIPLLGLPLYLIMSGLALYEVSLKGRYGLYNLKKGLYRLLLINGSLLLLFSVIWFWPRKVIYDAEYGIIGGMIGTKFSGDVTRNLKGEDVKIGRWLLTNDNFNLIAAETYYPFFGNNYSSKWMFYHENGNKYV